MSSSNSDVSQVRDNSVDQAQRYGASAYIDQSEYDTYQQPTLNSTSGANRGTYANYPIDSIDKNRYVQDVIDDDYSTEQQQQQQQQNYPKNSSTTSYAG